MSFTLDKSTWKRVRLGDVIRRSRTQVDPVSSGVERYVGGGHVDSEGVTIERWGHVDDGQMGSTFRYVFDPGQLLFVSARPYLRKVGVPDFGGVVADKTYVLNAVPENGLLQEFLPFVLSSDRFVEYATAEATGSMNPRLLWGPMQRYEFDLPPLDEQKRLADLLWSVEQHRQKASTVALALTLARNNLVGERLDAAATQPDTLESLIRPDTTITYGIVQAGPEVDGGVPYVRVSDMTGGALGLERMKRTSPSIAEKFERSRVNAGDLVVALRGRTGLTLQIPEELDGANLTQGTARVAVDETRVSPDYVLAVMNSEWMSRQVARQAKGSTFTELTLAALRSLPVPRLGESAEFRLVAEVASIDRAFHEQEAEIAALGVVRFSLLSSIFGGAA